MLPKLIYYGNPLLRKKTKKVVDFNEELKQLALDMELAMRTYDGIGLAAPQIGREEAIFVMSIPEYNEEDDSYTETPVQIYINPMILDFSEEEASKNEGCLSIPNIHGKVSRPVYITVKAQDLEGVVFERELTHLEARCFLHENDHLNGVLFVDRIKGAERKELESKLRQIKKLYSTKN